MSDRAKSTFIQPDLSALKIEVILNQPKFPFLWYVMTPFIEKIGKKIYMTT